VSHQDGTPRWHQLPWLTDRGDAMNPPSCGGATAAKCCSCCTPTTGRGLLRQHLGTATAVATSISRCLLSDVEGWPADGLGLAPVTVLVSSTPPSRSPLSRHTVSAEPMEASSSGVALLIGNVTPEDGDSLGAPKASTRGNQRTLTQSEAACSSNSDQLTCLGSAN